MSTSGEGELIGKRSRVHLLPKQKLTSWHILKDLDLQQNLGLTTVKTKIYSKLHFTIPNHK